MAALDPISNIIAEGASENVVEFTRLMKECSESFVALHKEASKTIPFNPKGTKELREWVELNKQAAAMEQKLTRGHDQLGEAMSAYQRIIEEAAKSQAKLAAAESQAAKDAAAAKVALQEKNLELRNEAQALDESYQARQKANEQARLAQVQAELEAATTRQNTLDIKSNLKELQALAREKERLAKSGARSATDPAQKQAFLDEAQAARDSLRLLKSYQDELKRSQVESNKAAKQTEYLSSSYNRLNAEHSQLYKTARDIGAEFGIESEQFKKAAAEANALDVKLKAIDTSLGYYHRKVGDYKTAFDGLGLSVQRVLQEAPSLAVNMNTFFLAISNNLPDLFNEIRKISAEISGLKAAAAAANVELAKQTAIQSVASKTAEQAEESLYGQIDAVVASVSASHEQAIALKEQIAGHIANAGATAEDAAAAAANTEATLLNAGASVEDAAALRVQTEATILATQSAAEATVALEAQTLATAEASAAAASQPSVLARLGKSLFSVTSLLTAGVLVLTLWGDKIVEAFTGGSEASKEAEKALKKYKDTIDSVAESERSSAQQEIAHMNVLITVSQNAEMSTRNRTRAIKELQETYPETFGNLTQQAILEGNLKDAVDKTSQALLNRAAFQAAEKRFAAASEKLYDLTIAQKKAQEEMAAAQEALNKANAPNKDSEQRGLEQFNAIDRITRTRRLLADISTDIAAAAKEQSQFLKDAQDYALKSGDALFGKDTGRVKPPPKDRDTTNRDIGIDTSMIDLDRRLAEQRINTQMAANKAIYDDETKSLTERLAAYDAYIQNRVTLIRSNSTYEQQEALLLLDRIKEIEQKGEKERTDQEKDLLAKREYYNKQVEFLTTQSGLQENELISLSLKERASILESDTKIRLKKLQDEVNAIKSARAKSEGEQLRALDDSYSKGEMSTRAYYSKRAEITKKASDDEYNAMVAWLDAQREALMNSDLPEEVRVYLENVFAQFPKVKADTTKGPSILELLGFGKKTVQQQKEELTKQIESLYNTIFSVIDSKRNAHYEQQFSLLDKEQDQIEKTAEAEKERIQSSLMAESEKERELAAIEKRKLASEQVLEQKRKAMARAKAIQEKRDAIFQASINAGIAIAKVFAGMGTSSGAVPLAIASAALIAAQTAANISMINSQPIPEYWKGTDNHPGGLAWLGERGREIVNLPTGESYITPDRATLANLPAGTEVIPNHVLAQEAEQSFANRLMWHDQAGRDLQYLDMAELKDEIRGLAGAFDRSVSKIPLHQTFIDEGGFHYGLNRATGRTKFVGGRKRWP